MREQRSEFRELCQTLAAHWLVGSLLADIRCRFIS